MDTAVIFRGELLPISETFIQAQAGALTHFRACYAGLERAQKSLAISPDPVLIARNDSIPERARRELFLHSGLAPRFYRQLRRLSPTLIHAHFAPDACVALPLIRELDVPLFVTLHGYDVTTSERRLAQNPFGRIYLSRRQELWDTTTRFICVSEFIRRRAIEAGFPVEKLLVHHIGIDRSIFASESRARQENLILFTGRLVEKKGCRYLLEAMVQVQREHPPATLVIIGEGPLRSSLETLAGQKGISCKFIGSQPTNVVKQWLAQCRVFCLPSVTADTGDSEGLPIVLAEAQSMGVPVVSTAHAGIPEVVCHGETGLLAEERNPEQIAENLLAYLKDEVFWRACSERAVPWIAKCFDLERQTEQLEEIYRCFGAPAKGPHPN